MAALNFYGDLQQNYSVTGAQDVDTTRAAYFAGKGAMLIWSSFILDEMAGLRKDALPTCPQCKSDPAFLAKNSGVVTSIEGPSGSGPATFGEVTSWTIPSDSSTDSAKKFVNYMMTDGYQPWITIAPEGKIPVRTGDKPGDTTYTDAWSKMKVGVDTKAPLSKFYSQDVIDALTSGADNLSRWAIPQGQGDLLGAIQGDPARGRRRQRGGQRHQRRRRGQEGGGRNPIGPVDVASADRRCRRTRPCGPTRARGGRTTGPAGPGPPAPARTGGRATC